MRNLLMGVILSCLYLGLRQKFSTPAFFGPSPVDYSLRWIFALRGESVQAVGQVFWEWFQPWSLSCGLPLLAWWLWYRRCEETQERSPDGRAVVAFAALVAAGLLVARRNVFNISLFSVDEYAYDFQAQLLSNFQLAAPPWGASELYCQGLLMTTDRVTTAWQPGWPACFALFKAVGLGLVANCVLWFLTVGAAWYLSLRMADRAAAHRTAVMVALCVPFWMLSMGEFPHIWIALLSCLLLAGYLRYRENAGVLPLFLCSFLVAVTRMQDLICLVVVVLIWEKKRRTPLVVMFGLSVLAALVVNHAQTGFFLSLPTLLVYDNLALYQLWFWRLLDAVHGQLFLLGRALWWTGPLFFLAAFRHKSSPWDRGLFAGLIVSVLVYLPKYGLASIDWNTRYYTQTLLLLCLILGPRLRLTRSSLLGLGLTFLLGLQTLHFCAASYRGIRIPPRVSGGICFIRTLPPRVSPDSQIRNGPYLKDQVSALWTTDERNRQLIRQFPHLTPYVADFVDGNYRISPYP